MARYDLNRFLKAQNDIYCGYFGALQEIKGGRKTSHWIWYIFPQFRGLGHSETALFYGLADVEEARQYIEHPVLGSRLREISAALLEHKGKDIVDVFGEVDAMKTRSCMTLFDCLAPDDVFGQVIDTFYDGVRDARTLSIIESCTSRNSPESSLPESKSFKVDEEYEQSLDNLLSDMLTRQWLYEQARIETLMRGVTTQENMERLRMYAEPSPYVDFLLKGFRLKEEDLKRILPPGISVEDVLEPGRVLPSGTVKATESKNMTDVHFIEVLGRTGKSTLLSALFTEFLRCHYYLAPMEDNLDDSCLSVSFYSGMLNSKGSLVKISQRTPDSTFIPNQIVSGTGKQSKVYNIPEYTYYPIMTMLKEQIENLVQICPDDYEAIRCLKNANRKVLFLILDYSIIAFKNNVCYDQTKQTLYLECLLDSLSSDGPDRHNPSVNCTLSKTNAVAIVMTKCDLMSVKHGEERIDWVMHYLEIHEEPFMNNLKRECERFDINRHNDYNPYVFAFSAGELTVGNTLLYDGTDAQKLVSFLTANPDVNHSSWLDRFLGRK